MTYPIAVLNAALLALTRININDTRIAELKRAVQVLEEFDEHLHKLRVMGHQDLGNTERHAVQLAVEKEEVQ